MKKNYMLMAALLLLSFTFLGSRAFAYNIVSHSEYDSCAGGASFIVNVNAANPNLTMDTYFGDGTGVFTSPIYGSTSPYAFKAHSYALAGVYTVKHVLKLSGVPVDSVQFSFATLCQYVQLRLFLDNNSNCVFDFSEARVPGPVDIEIDSAGVKLDTVKVYTSSWIRLTAGKTYTLKALNLPSGTSASCPSTGSITYTMPFTTSLNNVDFGFSCNPSSNFDMAVWAQGAFRPVSWSRIIVSAANLSCTTQSGVLTLHISPKYSYSSATQTPASITGNTLTWNVSNLSYGQSFAVVVYLTAATTVSVGDSVCYDASITPTVNDINTVNNYVSRCDSVRSSFDPNEKSVEPRGNISPGTKLTYRIDFENTGNDTAFNIRVLDTLSNNLDANTFAVQYSSHPVTSNLENGPAGTKVARFDFNNIKLADSNHKDANKGFVIFTINAKKALAPSTVIPNKAGIYFDINDVVMTNTVSNMIHPVGIKVVEKQTSAVIYPNPVHDILSIKVNDGQYETARLLNALGQVLVSEHISGEHMQMSVKALTPGIYYLELKGSAGIKVEKIEKQ